MLKIEKYHKNHQLKVGIILQKRSPLLTPYFLIALSIAITFHVIPLYFFKIPSNELNYLDSAPIQAVNLKIDFSPFLDLSRPKELLEIDIIQLSKIDAAVPPETKVQLLYPKSKKQIFSTFQGNIIESENIDSKINELDVGFLENSPIEIFLRLPEYTIEAFGNLAGLLKNCEQLKYINATYKNIERTKAIFEVVVEQTSGQIVWYEAKNTFSKNLLLRSEKILKNLEFNLNFVDSYVKGQIEMNFNEVKND